MLHVHTQSGKWGPFCRQIEEFLKADTIELCLDGIHIRGFRSPDTPALWIRDHSEILRGGKYVESDVRSAVSAFGDTQAANGRIFDYVTTFPEKTPCERENWEKWVRVPVEADVEYRFVKAAFLAWQASGSEDWLDGRMPMLERALSYCTTHPWRWDDGHRLIKRPYTIDTWDFDYTAGAAPWLNFQVTDRTFWGIMHGDNSGFYEASGMLGTMCRALGRSEDADRWSSTAEELRERANRLLFNGRFYTHFHKITPVTVDGVDESEQLSLSNPMAINRGLATHEMAVAILREYRRRAETTDAFAEWFSIDPPFPDGIFGDEKLKGGAYVNGGILPLVGGELARAAFEHGFERYAVDTLRQYAEMIAESGETYLWYFPDGTPSTDEASTSPEATPTDGWGSSAMLYAFVEGLCGITDLDHSYRRVRCAPRWVAAQEEAVSVDVSYADSGSGFGYTFRHRPDVAAMILELRAGASDVDVQILLPDRARVTRTKWNERETAYSEKRVENSAYACSRGSVRGEARVEIQYSLA